MQPDVLRDDLCCAATLIATLYHWWTVCTWNTPARMSVRPQNDVIHTCCLPVCCLAAALRPSQALFAADPGQLRSLSKGESHFGSFNRHFPVARCSSKNQEVHQVRIVVQERDLTVQLSGPYQACLCPLVHVRTEEHRLQQEPGCAPGGTPAAQCMHAPQRNEAENVRPVARLLCPRSDAQRVSSPTVLPSTAFQHCICIPLRPSLHRTARCMHCRVFTRMC